jgi:hypothetical protein
MLVLKEKELVNLIDMDAYQSLAKNQDLFVCICERRQEVKALNENYTKLRKTNLEKICETV